MMKHPNLVPGWTLELSAHTQTHSSLSPSPSSSQLSLSLGTAVPFAWITGSKTSRTETNTRKGDEFSLNRAYLLLCFALARSFATSSEWKQVKDWDKEYEWDCEKDDITQHKHFSSFICTAEPPIDSPSRLNLSPSPACCKECLKWDWDSIIVFIWHKWTIPPLLLHFTNRKLASDPPLNWFSLASRWV